MDLAAAANAARDALEKAKKAAQFQKQIAEQMALSGTAKHSSRCARALLLGSIFRGPLTKSRFLGVGVPGGRTGGVGR